MADKVMIHVEQLRKDYGSGRYAVDGISFDVRAGEVLGFLGPNGAGKTTTMKILTSFLAPTSGRARGGSLAVSAQRPSQKRPRCTKTTAWASVCSASTSRSRRSSG